MLNNPRSKWYVGHMGPNRFVIFPYSMLVTQKKFGKYFYSVIGPLKTQKDAEAVVKRLNGMLVVVNSVRDLDTLPTRNPGAGWHRTEELRSQQRESDSIRLGRKDLESFYRGSKMAHRESRLESERLGENPGQYYSKSSWWFVQSKHGDVKIVQKGERPIGRIVVGPFNTRKFAERYAWARLEVKENPCPKRRNPVVRGTKIYDKIQAIEAQKGDDSLWPGEDFRHDFKGGGEIYGLENGDLLIKKKKKKLWKNFDY